MTIKLLKELAPMCQGIHFMPFGWSDIIPEVLAEIKADPELRRIPVVILTVSKAEEDVLKSYNLHANCYITKPVNLDQFLEVVKSIEDFWLTVVMLPPR